MKSLKTEDRLIKKIVANKLNTLVVDDDQNFSVDDRVEIINSAGKAVGFCFIDSVMSKRQKDIGSRDTDVADQLEFLQAGGLEATKPVKILKFKFEAYEKPKTVALGAEKYESLKMFSDGGSRGNPGPSASGYVLMTEADKVVKEVGVYLGVTTNNQAEYKSLQFGLEDALSLGARKISVFMDSQLVINQMNGSYKIKNRDLLPIYRNIKDLETKFEEISYTHVPREFNKLADSEVNKALDAELGE